MGTDVFSTCEQPLSSKQYKNQTLLEILQAHVRTNRRIRGTHTAKSDVFAAVFLSTSDRDDNQTRTGTDCNTRLAGSGTGREQALGEATWKN